VVESDEPSRLLAATVGRIVKPWPGWVLVAVIAAAVLVAIALGHLDEWLSVIAAFVFVVAVAALVARVVKVGEE